MLAIVNMCKLYGNILSVIWVTSKEEIWGLKCVSIVLWLNSIMFIVTMGALILLSQL